MVNRLVMMLQIRTLFVEASGSSVSFLPLLSWHATQRRCENEMAYLSLSQPVSEKRWLIVSDAGEKVFALTSC